MKVMLLNGSPNEKGCTYTALREIEKVLNKHEIETEIVYLGKKPIAGCIACSKCFETGKCIWNDKVNETAKRLDEIDGLIIGSPVYYASANGSLIAFLDRLFFSAGEKMAGKLGASIVSCRRAGSTAAFDQLNKYFTISNMPIVSSNYWNQVHGFTPEDVMQDKEGLQIMRTLGENMAWLLKCIEAGKKMNIQKPEYEEKIMTNFIK
ncbi:flavodoxin family protein [Fusobacterium varium]|uniref:flavodoxin family protein n=1 Tax=Fusobacterium varium TaxID=856 RepID=UPI000BBA481B|nr:putative flavodoxin [Fusobacterium varium]